MCLCRHSARVIARSEPQPPPVGMLILLEYRGSEPPQVVYGEVTNIRYPFHLKKRLFVDTRDAVFMLGPDYDSN